MATPTITGSYRSPISLNVTGVNIDAGDTDVKLPYTSARLSKGFSVETGTLTAVDVKVFSSNGAGTPKDLTNCLFGVDTLQADKVYVCDTPLSVKEVLVRITQTNPTNEVNLDIFSGND